MLRILILLLSISLLTKATIFDLNDGDFASTLSQHEPMLVMFYAPWCHHCQKLHSKFDELPLELVKNNMHVRLAKVDCVGDGTETCNEENIEGYPTIKLYRYGKKSVTYDGKRENSDIIEFLNGQIVGSKELHTEDQLEKFLVNQREICVVGFFDTESPILLIFLSVAEKLGNKLKFAHFSSDHIDNEFIGNNIVLFRPGHMQSTFEQNYIIFNADDGIPLEKWIIQNMHGITGLRTPNNQNDFNKPIIIIYYNVDYVRDLKGTNYWRNRILQVAKHHQNKFTFAISSINDFKHELKKFGINYQNKTKPIVIAIDEDNQKYLMNDEFTVEVFDGFIHNLLDAKIDPYIKSEPIPECNNGSVKIAVANNFKTLVLENKKDVLIKFYAPWCGHCKILAPIYEHLGKLLENEDVEIVKIDATANDIPGPFIVNGYPTVYWLSKNNKTNAIEYTGVNKFEELIQFISKHATQELLIFDRHGHPKFEKEL